MGSLSTYTSDWMCVFIVDDSPADARMLIEGLRQGGLAFRVFGTGDQVLRALADAVADSNLEQPSGVILDLNLPGKNGFEVLEAIRRTPKLQTLPVAMLTTSDDPKDRRRAAELGATAFHTKPLEFDGWTEVLAEILTLLPTKH